MRKKGHITRTGIIKRSISDKEFKLFVNNFKLIKHKVLFRILRYEGLRLSEALQLNIIKKDSNYLNLKEGTITFHKQKNGNDGEIWYIRKRSLGLLKAYVKLKYKTITSFNGWLFWSSWTGSHLKMYCIESLLHRYRKKLGFDNDIYGIDKRGYKKHRITFHSCKHEHHREVLKNMAKKWQKIDTISALMLTRHKSLPGLQPYINEIHQVKKHLVNNLMN